MRPIMLTAAAATLALIPISREIFWGPMAYAMMGGIVVGTVLTLLFLPALYLAWFRIKRPEGNWTSRQRPRRHLEASPPANDATTAGSVWRVKISGSGWRAAGRPPRRRRLALWAVYGPLVFVNALNAAWTCL